jgi:hypothetical protein
MGSGEEVRNAIRHCEFVPAAAAAKRPFEQFPRVGSDRTRNNFKLMSAQGAPDGV